MQASTTSNADIKQLFVENTKLKFVDSIIKRHQTMAAQSHVEPITSSPQGSGSSCRPTTCPSYEKEEPGATKKDDGCAEYDGTIRVQSGSGFRILTPFPWRLHEMLEDMEKTGQQWIVSWLPDGRSFQVHCPTQFVEVVSPKYFRHKRYKSFQRQLYLYGFKSVEDTVSRGAFLYTNQESSGLLHSSNIVPSLFRCWPPPGAYTHPYFVRENRKLCQLITRTKKSTNKNNPETSVNKLQPPLPSPATSRSLTKLEPSMGLQTSLMRIDDKNDSQAINSSADNPNHNHQQHLRAVAESYLEALGTNQVGMLPPSQGRLAPISMGQTARPLHQQVSRQQAPPLTLSHDSFFPEAAFQQEGFCHSNASFQQDGNTTALSRFLNDSRVPNANLRGNTSFASTNSLINAFDQDQADDVKSNSGAVDPLSSYRGLLSRSGQAKDCADFANATAANPTSETGTMGDPRLQDTLQWLLTDLHVPVGDLKNALTVSSNAATSSNTCSIPNVTATNITRPFSSNCRGSNSNMINQYKEDIISLFGDQ